MHKTFVHADFLDQLKQHTASPSGLTDAAAWPAALSMLRDARGAPSRAAMQLVELLQAKQAMLRAASDTELVADSLRRYQKFAKPGQPSPHIVQLRQQQASARQATSQARQSFVAAAAAFVREAGIDVPERVALQAFMERWIEINVPTDMTPAA